MAKLIYGLNQSLDGYVEHQNFAPGPALFRHFIEQVSNETGMLYGRRMYEIMRYWDDDLPDWNTEERAFAAAWRSKPKWVVSRTLTAVGPHATLLQGNIETAIRELKSQQTGVIELAGPDLAGSLAGSGLIDEYQIYLHPVVTGGSKRFFTGPRPPLRLVSNEVIADDVIRLTYVPA
jgi:dihydrofolate reductase